MSEKNRERTLQRNRGGTVSGDGGKILSHRALKYKWFLCVDYFFKVDAFWVAPAGRQQGELCGISYGLLVLRVGPRSVIVLTPCV